MEEIEKKAAELSAKYLCKVTPVVFKDENDLNVVGYVKEPNRESKARVMDKSMTSPVTAACELLDAIIIKAESDTRIISQKSEDDKYYLGAAMSAYSLIELSLDIFKKK